jgi:4a-hydroxytetrahydrobiopterin dehydratase
MDLLTEEQIAAHLADHADWTRQGDEIVHVETLADFAAAIRYVDAVANLAEAANHHPDILIQWNKVTLNLATHSAGGLTAKDFELAGQLSSLG